MFLSLKKGPDSKVHLSMFFKNVAQPAESLQHFVFYIWFQHLWFLVSALSVSASILRCVHAQCCCGRWFVLGSFFQLSHAVAISLHKWHWHYQTLKAHIQTKMEATGQHFWGCKKASFLGCPLTNGITISHGLIPQARSQYHSSQPQYNHHSAIISITTIIHSAYLTKCRLNLVH